MVGSARKSLILLLPLLFAAAVPSTIWGQDEAESSTAEVLEGLGPIDTSGDINPELPADPEEMFSEAAVDAVVDSPVDSLFDSSTDYITTVGTPGAMAQNQGVLAPVAPSDRGKGLFERRRLTGEWWGRRTSLQQNGIRYRGRVTQYFFGVQGGIRPPVPPQFARLGIAGGDTFEYTGNSRHDLLVDLDKLGGPEHGKFLVTLENLWGRYGNVSFETGAITPAVFNAMQPVGSNADGTFYVTNFAYAQRLSENLILTVGKSRLVAIADRNILAGGDGSDQFLNQTFCMNPLYVPQLPFSTFAVGAVSPQEWGVVGLTVIDPQERTTEFMDLGNLFADGVTIKGQIRFNTQFFNQPGQHHVGGFYKHVDLLNLEFTPIPPIYPYPPAPDGTPQFATLPSSYTIVYGFDQYVTTYGPPTVLGHFPGWGFFGRAGISDGGTGNPNFSAWHLSGGIGGESPLATRRDKGDRFGIGYGYTGTSTEYGPIPRALFDPRDGQVFESYYSWQATPAIAVTPDLQWIRGSLAGLTDHNDAFVFGIRMNVRL